jgi:hypothetical protein
VALELLLGYGFRLQFNVNRQQRVNADLKSIRDVEESVNRDGGVTQFKPSDAAPFVANPVGQFQLAKAALKA